MGTGILLLGIFCLLVGIGGMLWAGGKRVWGLKGLARWAAVTGIGVALIIGYVQTGNKSAATKTLEQQVAAQSHSRAEGLYQWMLGLLTPSTYSGSSSGGTTAPSAWPPALPTGWTKVQDLTAGPLPSLADGNYQIVAEAPAQIVVGSDITNFVRGKLAFTLSSGTATDASGGTIWTTAGATPDTPVLATTGRAILINS